MKTTRTTTRALLRASNNTRRGHKPLLHSPAVPVFPEASTPGVQWPTEKQIAGVSKQLSRIAELGIRSEASGDYFKSGDLAYQLQEIIRATAELLRRSERTKE